MFRRIAHLALIAALLAMPLTAFAGQAANYEISSYVIYMTVQEDGDVHVREEIIYNNPGAYSGLSLTVNLEGTNGLSDVAVWRDGEALDELPEADARLGEAQGFTVKEENGRALVKIVAPGDSDSHAFACAYNLAGLARRYEDTALLERALISADREVMLQNAAAIVKLPRSDGEMLAYVDGGPEEIPLLVKYDTVNIGPIDVAADEALSLQLLFPAEWLDKAETKPMRMRESVVAPRRQAEAAIERETNARRAEQYTATAVYASVFIAALLVLMKKYGVRKGHIPAELDEALLEKYPPAYTVYAARDKAGVNALTATLADLARRGIVCLREGDGGVSLRLENRPQELKSHEKAALDIVFSGEAGEWIDISALYTPGNEAQARRLTDRFADYDKAVAADAHAAGLTWRNDAILIVTALLNILCGVILGFVLLLVGKRMLLEACCVAVFMFVMIGQLNRVRTLTDAGEALQRAAYALQRDPSAMARHIPLGRAVGEWSAHGAEKSGSEEAKLFDELHSRLNEIFYGAATLRRSRKKK
ncbi:MAG: DUF2207 domain-containing protein [Clostridia bacterium]|nr:DUF2207 domain-containing protein [Clostridia bacterium]